MKAPSAGGLDEQRLRAFVNGRVDCRFSLDANAFAGCVLEITRRHGVSGAEAVEFASRLSLDDLYLASACVSGDERAWESCVTSHRDFIHRFARRVLKEPEASDVADQVIADLWQRRKIERYEGRSTLRTWLGTVVSHAAINALKASKSHEEREAPAPTASSDDLETHIGDVERSVELAKLLAESISRQPTPDQLLVLLYYEQQLTLDEIGPIVGLSKAALSRRLKRIRDALLETTDALARRRLGTSARSLAEGLELSTIDLDLRAACRLAVEQRPTDVEQRPTDLV